MKPTHYEVISHRRPFADIAADLEARLFGGVDVELTQVGTLQALVREHVVRALMIQEETDDASPLFEAAGATLGRPVFENDATALVRFRLPEELEPRPQRSLPARVEFAEQLRNVRIPEAWTLLGGPSHIDWTGVKIGQIDTGYREHPVLGFGQPGGTWIDVAACRTFRRLPGNNAGPPPVSDPDNGVDVYSGGGSDGHGTRIGGAISGHHLAGDGNADYFGAAPKVPHVVVRISDCVVINEQLDAFAEGLDHLVASGAGAVNLSMGMALGALTSRAKAAINRAYDAGVILVCAGGQIVDKPIHPARDARSIAVGGVTLADTVWSEASKGPQIDWAAPAKGIRRAEPGASGNDRAYRGDGDGTSYATAFTTGAAALWLAHHRDRLPAAYPQPWQRVAAFVELGRGTTRKPPGWRDGVVGTGILDVRALLDAPLPAAGTLLKDGAL